ncbi:MAG: hypothetical protein ACC655_05690, partial [Rhodothermia bacterium]
MSIHRLHLNAFIFLFFAVQFLAGTSVVQAQVSDPTLSISIDAVAAPSAVSGKVSFQGYIEDNGSPANGPYDFELKVYDALVSGAQQGSTHSAGDLEVTNGVFNIEAS